MYLLLSQPQPKPNQETQLLPQPASLSTQPASSPSPPSQLLENNLNPTPILPKIQDPSSKSQALETVNTSNSSSQPEATKESILKGKTCEPVKKQILTDGKVDSQLIQNPIEKTFSTKLFEPTKNSSNCSEKKVEPNL
ncbi:MAG: hypothetical protein PUP93_15050 [Rhizonema sp. NSF051]|nr:hypothetical protein [Rhizonema sp. NSF051]